MKMKSKSNKNKVETLEEFLTKIEQLNEGIAEINDNVDKLKTVNHKIINEPSQEERRKLVSVQEEYIHRNKQIGKKLQKLVKEEKHRLSKTPAEFHNSEHSVKTTQLQTASKRFLDAWTEYNNVQLEYREKNKKKLLRMLTNQSTKLTPDEIEEKLDNGDVTVLSSILKETDQAKSDLKMIENRHAEIIKLEKGISEIHEMFMDLSYLVSEQGEVLDRIEDHVNNAAAEVESGRQQLQSAERYQKRSRRLKFILAAILAGVAIVTIVLLAIFLG